MSVALSDFNVKQLQALYAVVAEKIDDLEGKKKITENYIHVPCELKDSLLEIYDKDLEDYRLWIVQIVNALDEVQTLERISSN